MRKIQIYTKITTESSQRFIYELEIPENIEEEDIENYIMNKQPKLTAVKQFRPKKLNEKFELKEVLEEENWYFPEDEEEGNKRDLPTVKEVLNMAIMKNDKTRFRNFFLANNQELTSNEYYLLLYNALNSHLFDISALLLSHSHNILTEKHVSKLMSSVGVVNNEEVLRAYIKLGYDKVDFGGVTLMEMYKKKGYLGLLEFFDK